MRRFVVLLFSILLAAAAVAARAQTVPAASAHQFSITAGGMASIFQPDFAGMWVCSVPMQGTTCPSNIWDPIAQASNQPLFGAGAFVDVKLTRWVQIEAEGRWLRFNRYSDIHEDNYLIGPRVPVYRFWKATLYGKALGGFSKMDLGYGAHCTCTDIAFGGGMDVKLTKRLSFRAADVEYQYWPKWGNSTLSPYGASMGIGYKIF
jgi:hypothetical protein